MNTFKTLAFLVAFTAAAAAQAALTPIDLSTWDQKGPRKNGQWQVSPDGKSVMQLNNGNPSFFVSPDQHLNTTLRGTLRVENNWDDDFIGFVFGYKSPQKNGSDLDFYLFDWKRGTQTIGGYEAVPGFTLNRVKGNIPLTGDSFDPVNPLPQFWGHKESNEFKVLDRLQHDNLGWDMDTDYNFEILYQENRVKIDVSGGKFGAGFTVFDISGDFQEGQFGFYNFSQESVVYKGWSQEDTPPHGGDVPEPGFISLIALGLAGLGMNRRTRRPRG